jgi:hypothetical protein
MQRGVLIELCLLHHSLEMGGGRDEVRRWGEERGRKRGGEEVGRGEGKEEMG